MEKNFPSFKTTVVNTFPAIKQITMKILIACSAFVRFTRIRNAAAILHIWRMVLNHAVIVCYPMTERVMATL